ncbi:MULTISPECIES: toprim domain-containing protein [Salegentibacter]|uniref:CHC2 zinc finger n=1 Tax=Salegentibacter agarivorans TaxID=345907 RepID=A0A1I2KYM3_9FLAO|nr:MULTISPECIES: toprim domain-containing protein [Salegentibacter]SFF71458.1 CHC2 zinc finger [Salegentibacter agarivorans]
MNLNNLSCKSARNICLVKILAKLGHFPIRTTEKEAWFLSPLRSETQASFSVSLIKNLWFDFGMGVGGNTIDLIMAIKSYSVREALEFLKDDPDSFSFSPPSTKPSDQGISILEVQYINLIALIHYLESRNIPFELARKYCMQVWYRSKGKQFFAIGLKNHLGGWELRNKYFKTSSSPKTYSLIQRDAKVQRDAKQLIILEGMFDFLSLATIDEDLVQNSDCIILNSLAFLDRVKIFIPVYKRVLLYLDNDPAGKKATATLLSLYDHITDCSDSYSEYADLNEKLKDEKAWKK